MYSIFYVTLEHTTKVLTIVEPQTGQQNRLTHKDSHETPPQARFTFTPKAHYDLWGESASEQTGYQPNHLSSGVVH